MTDQKLEEIAAVKGNAVQRTSIEWCDFSANPLKYRDASGRVVWACVHASPGCQHCYAETLAKRYSKGGPFNVPTTAKVAPFLDELELRRMLTYKPASGRRCFVGDMTDLFGEWVPDLLIAGLWEVFERRSDVTWQVLTKRAQRLASFWSRGARPLPNVWLGVSCEDQQRADERIPLLLETPAAVRFVSAEPLLGPLDLQPYLHGTTAIDWVIPGGESNGRPCDVEWIRSIVRQCASYGVACFVKQLGSNVVDRNDAGFEGDTSGGWPMDTDTEDLEQGWQGQTVRVRLGNRKGGAPAEWPADLRVRQFPRSAVPA